MNAVSNSLKTWARTSSFRPQACNQPAILHPPYCLRRRRAVHDPQNRIGRAFSTTRLIFAESTASASHPDSTNLHSADPESTDRPPSNRIPQTHYDFFPSTVPRGPPPRGPFPIDLKSLHREFLKIQNSAHPDRHPSSQKQRAEALSARINEAYKTLQDPLKRAQYILSLNGIDVAEDETAKVEDNELLMRVLETREEIEEAEDEKELEGLREENDRDLGESVKVLDGAFEKGDWETARREAVKLRYWVNIKESLESWEKGKPVVLQH